jgi:hypothetical protein
MRKQAITEQSAAKAEKINKSNSTEVKYNTYHRFALSIYPTEYCTCKVKVKVPPHLHNDNDNDNDSIRTIQFYKIKFNSTTTHN